MNLSQMMADDSAEKKINPPTDDDLRTVAELANEQLRLERLVWQQEEDLKASKELLTKVRELDLPSALEVLGLTMLKLVDGSTVTVKEDVYAAITEANREAAFEWLESTDNDGIIKNEVKCPFGKGQDTEAKALVDLLTAQGYSFTNARTVHPQTLRAFVRKQLEDALPIPTDIFSICIKKVASIKTPKYK